MQELITKYFDHTITAEERKQLFDALENNSDLRREFTKFESEYQRNLIKQLYSCLNDRFALKR